MMMCQYERELQLPFYMVDITEAADGEEIKVFIISCRIMFLTKNMTCFVNIMWPERSKMPVNVTCHLALSSLCHVAGISLV